MWQNPTPVHNKNSLQTRNRMNSTYNEIYRIDKSVETETEWVVARPGRKENGERLLMDIGFIYGDKIVLSLESNDVT